MFYQTQKFLVLGVSKSGCAVAKYLLSHHAKCFVYDDSLNNKAIANINELTTLGAVQVLAENVDKVISEIDVLVISPGVPINHEMAIKAKSNGKKIIGELEFGFLQFEPPIVAVTGTNGKTTTVSLIDAILNESKTNHVTVGNIGLPITSVLDSSDRQNVFVAEVSSFQLESVCSFCPHIACVLNIAPDHLERHYSMDNYIFLKKRIFKNQRESEFTVLNYDDETVKNFSSETRSKVVWVSVKEEVDGAYLLNGGLYYRGEYILSENELSLQGEHNIYDALFALTCAKLLNIDNKFIITALTEFKGVKHRLEKVLEKDGIVFYNDSKSTNTASCINALNFMKTPFVLILGGSEKNEDYSKLFLKIKESDCVHIVITGASRFNMFKSARENGIENITLTSDFDTALNVAFSSVKSGETVLFSPACASFDMFNSYEERGEAFIKAVKEFAEE